MEHVRGSARLLASVTNDREARLVASLGADVIDAKNPSTGALGALPAATVTAIRAAHVPQLLALSPDILGFRGGLCRQGERTSEIDAEAVRAVRRIIPVCDAAQGQACRPLLPGAMAPRQAKDVA